MTSALCFLGFRLSRKVKTQSHRTFIKKKNYALRESDSLAASNTPDVVVRLFDPIALSQRGYLREKIRQTRSRRRASITIRGHMRQISTKLPV